MLRLRLLSSSRITRTYILFHEIFNYISDIPAIVSIYMYCTMKWGYWIMMDSGSEGGV